MSSPPSTEPDESSRGPERNEAGSEQPCVVNSNEEINYMEDIEDNVEMSAEGSSSGSNRNTSLLGEPSSANIEAVENVTTPIEQNNSEIISEGEEVPGDALDDVVRQTTRTRRRYYRRRSGTEDSSEDENSVVPGASTPRRRGRWEEYFMSGSSSTSSLNSAHEEDLRSAAQLLQDAPTPRALQKPKPIHKWFAVKEIIGRERGAGGRWQAAERFQHRYYGSLHAVQRLELMYKLGGHRGCVNSLSFNRGGDMLLSASDDRRVLVWNWAADKRILSFDSGHTGNVFQAKFLPMSGDTHIATCGADGQVRLAVLSCFGLCKGTRQLAQHRRSTHKLATHPDTPQVFLSAGEDALVYSHDVRTSKASKLLYVRELGAKVGLYSINSNPVCSNEFIVTGEDQYIRLYDKRKTHTLLNKFCPKNLLKPDVFLHVTCAVFNYNGTEIVGSYNDDDIYLFDTRQPEGSDYVYKYEGHRNSITVKGVNFFGPRSEFIVSGSDCGNIYFWDKNTEAIVQWMRGDEEGVVNCLEPHPQVPIIATSGLDSDIKIWVPSCEQEPTLQGLKDTVVSNHTDRAETRQRRSDPYDNQQMRWLWQQIQRFEQRRANRLSERQDDDDDVVHETSETRQNAGDDNSSSSSSEEEGGPSGRPQCSPS